VTPFRTDVTLFGHRLTLFLRHVTLFGPDVTPYVTLAVTPRVDNPHMFEVVS
jgi:hypothetical protein